MLLIKKMLLTWTWQNLLGRIRQRGKKIKNKKSIRMNQKKTINDYETQARVSLSIC